MSGALDPVKTGSMFKTYDIRGIVPDELTPEIAYRIGRGLVLYLGVDERGVAVEQTAAIRWRSPCRIVPTRRERESDGAF